MLAPLLEEIVRPQSTGFGKNTERLETMVDPATKEMFTALAVLSGMTNAEYLRYMIQGHCHGYPAMARIAHRRGFASRDTGDDSPEI